VLGAVGGPGDAGEVHEGLCRAAYWSPSLAREFGATDVVVIVAERGDEGVAKIKQLTGGLVGPAAGGSTISA